jgi:hypothetical protein
MKAASLSALRTSDWGAEATLTNFGDVPSGAHTQPRHVALDPRADRAVGVARADPVYEAGVWRACGRVGGVEVVSDVSPVCAIKGGWQQGCWQYTRLTKSGTM